MASAISIYVLVLHVNPGHGPNLNTYSWYTLHPLVPVKHRINSTTYVNIVADSFHRFMTIENPSVDCFKQEDDAPCHISQIISKWFLENDNEFTEYFISLLGHLISTQRKTIGIVVKQDMCDIQ